MIGTDDVCERERERSEFVMLTGINEDDDYNDYVCEEVFISVSWM